jgi:hypothetical protein
MFLKFLFLNNLFIYFWIVDIKNKKNNILNIKKTFLKTIYIIILIKINKKRQMMRND